MSSRRSRQSGKNRRSQTPKPRNKGFAMATLDHARGNLTVPSGTVYKRSRAGTKGREW